MFPSPEAQCKFQYLKETCWDRYTRRASGKTYLSCLFFSKFSFGLSSVICWLAGEFVALCLTLSDIFSVLTKRTLKDVDYFTSSTKVRVSLTLVRKLETSVLMKIISISYKRYWNIPDWKPTGAQLVYSSWLNAIWTTISDNIDSLGLGYYSPFPYLRSSTYLRCFTSLWCLTNLRYFSYFKNFTYLSTFLTVDASLTWGTFLIKVGFFTWGALLAWDALLTWGAFLCWAALLELLYFIGVLHLLEVLLLLEVFHLLELFLSGKVFYLRRFTNLSCFTLFCTPLIRS